MRHRLPDLVAGEGQDRAEELGQGVEDQVHRGLSRAALDAVARLAVEAVLQNVQIELAELGHAEIVDRVGQDMELIVVIGFEGGLDQLVQPGHGPAVELQHLLGLD